MTGGKQSQLQVLVLDLDWSLTILSIVELTGYTTTIGILSMKEAERIYTFKLLVSKLFGGRGGSDNLPGWGDLGDSDYVQNFEVFFNPISYPKVGLHCFK